MEDGFTLKDVMQRNLASSTRHAVHTMGRSRIHAHGTRIVLSTTPPITVISEDTLERKYYLCAHVSRQYSLGEGQSFKLLARGLTRVRKPKDETAKSFNSLL